MKYILFIALIAMSCGKSSDSRHDGGDGTDAETNEILYNQVMEIHDDVMPQMSDIYRLKTTLQDSIAKTPAMGEDLKKEMEAMIVTLDSVDNAMRIWMREFNPLPDSADQETARAYLEGQIEQIKEIKDFTRESLDKAKALTGK